MNERPQLDGFETVLLNELQAHVEDHSAVTSDVYALVGARNGQHKRRWQIALAAAAAAGVVALLVPTLAPTPAYAVTGRNGGVVHVKVNRLEGSDGLEQALAKRGIAADITYLPLNKQCAADRYAAVSTRGLTLSVGTDTFEVTIPADAVGQDDTFVLDASVVPLRDGVQVRVSFDIAHGVVAPCTIVTSP